MWIAFAFGSAFFAGVTAILAKCGIKNTDSGVATALRTVVVLVFSWGIVFIRGVAGGLPSVSLDSWIFLVLSGLATGASWLCYMAALKDGDVNKVVPIDKSSTVLTIILAFIFLGDSITWIKAVSVAAIAAGTLLMTFSGKKSVSADRPKGKRWLIFAVLSAVFASLTAILGKIGISGVDSDLGTAIRTFVVLIMAWLVVFVSGKRSLVRHVEKRDLLFICLSGIATGASWLCYYKALHDGLASVVVPIDKLSILITILFSFLVFKEKLTARSAVGLVLIVAGTLAMVL